MRYLALVSSTSHHATMARSERDYPHVHEATTTSEEDVLGRVVSFGGHWSSSSAWLRRCVIAKSARRARETSRPDERRKRKRPTAMSAFYTRVGSKVRREPTIGRWYKGWAWCSVPSAAFSLLRCFVARAPPQPSTSPTNPRPACLPPSYLSIYLTLVRISRFALLTRLDKPISSQLPPSRSRFVSACE